MTTEKVVPPLSGGGNSEQLAKAGAICRSRFSAEFKVEKA